MAEQAEPAVCHMYINVQIALFFILMIVDLIVILILEVFVDVIKRLGRHQGTDDGRHRKAHLALHPALRLAGKRIKPVTEIRQRQHEAVDAKQDEHIVHRQAG